MFMYDIPIALIIATEYVCISCIYVQRYSPWRVFHGGGTRPTFRRTTAVFKLRRARVYVVDVDPYEYIDIQLCEVILCLFRRLRVPDAGLAPVKHFFLHFSVEDHSSTANLFYLVVIADIKTMATTAASSVLYLLSSLRAAVTATQSGVDSAVTPCSSFSDSLKDGSTGGELSKQPHQLTSIRQN